MGMDISTLSKKQELPLSIPIQVSKKYNGPCIELRKTITITNPELIKLLISCAFHNQTVIIKPEFTNDMMSLRKLVEMGILYIDKKNGDYFFTF